MLKIGNNLIWYGTLCILSLVSVHFAVTFLDCWRTSFCVTTITKIVNNNTDDKQTSDISGVFKKGGGQDNLEFDWKCRCNKVLFVQKRHSKVYRNPIAPSFYSISPWNTLSIAIMSSSYSSVYGITVAGIQIFSFFILFSDLKFLHIGQCMVNMFLHGKISLWTNYFTNKEGLFCYYNLFTYNMAFERITISKETISKWKILNIS